MSATPRTGELTTQVSPAETTIPRAGQAAPEGATGVNAGLVANIEAGMTRSPANSVDAGIASLLGIDIDQIPAPTVPKPKASVTEQTPVPDEIKPTPARLFPFVSQAESDLAEAKSRNASLGEEREYQANLDKARSKEFLLMSGAQIIQIDAEIASAKQNGASKEALAALLASRAQAIQERNKAYESVFEQIKNQSKARNKTFSEGVDEYLLTEAHEIARNARTSLKEAEASGNTDEIALARIRLQAADMHTSAIEKKKRSMRGILATLAIFTASFLGNSFKSSTGGLQPKSR